MWYTWTTLLLVSCALAEAEPGAEVTTEAASVATSRAPPRTLDRKAAELAWKSWLQSPESVNPNAPPRRITTKSLFIPPLVCPKGQRLDRNGCVEVVTIDKTEHERILLEQLNALFPTPNSSTNGDVLYDYDFVDEPGPLQLSIPIGLDPLAAPLQGQEQADQALESQSNQVKVDKKDVANGQDNGTGIEAELELMKLQNSLNKHSNKSSIDASDILNHNVLINAYHYPEKPKRDSVAVNSTETETISNTADEGQKEVVFGHVNIDQSNTATEIVNSNLSEVKTNLTTVEEITAADNNSSASNDNIEQTSTSPTQALNKGEEKSKLKPENDYSDIGEAIKLISRYADVTTDDNFTKDDSKGTRGDEPILGTRTKLQYRRKKPQVKEIIEAPAHVAPPPTYKQAAPLIYANNGLYYRYPWPNQNSPSPPPNYPFRHLQDYWPGRNHIGGVYNTHENPRRHHHSFPQNYRLHGYPHTVTQSAYPEKLKGYIHRVAQRRISPRSHNQELYSLLGLRHWFSSEGTSKR